MEWVIVATAPELCQKCDFFLKKEDERNFCSGIYAYFRWNAFNVHKIWNPRTDSFVYQMFWPSSRVSKYNQYVAVNDPTTGPEHPIYRTMCTVWNTWITFKMLCPQISNWVLSEIQAYWYIILHAYMWVRGISLYSKDEKICKKQDKGELSKTI